MKYKVIRRRKLSQEVALSSIHSIVKVNSPYNEALAITFKSSYVGTSRFPIYNGGVIFITLDHFTYNFPGYVAFPSDQYDNIVLVEKWVYSDEGELINKLIHAKITKPVKY